MSTASDLSHQRALEFIAAYEKGWTSRQIAQLMGWDTGRPAQMVNNYKNRLVQRGYRINGRGMGRLRLVEEDPQ